MLEGELPSCRYLELDSQCSTKCYVFLPFDYATTYQQMLWILEYIEAKVMKNTKSITAIINLSGLILTNSSIKSPFLSLMLILSHIGSSSAT